MKKHDYLNWLKANRKQINAGILKTSRVERFSKLLILEEKYKRINQYM